MSSASATLVGSEDSWLVIIRVNWLFTVRGDGEHRVVGVGRLVVLL